ncbi:uncharacterized protein LOC124930220 [Impatiens glandulifera]|uniref:uncharacterized protein LOC124930220 n=1 Tax=Impatiens glandulifera TaxID=253017 RepID=UPI001FB165ED|nr:uncharacterized protein LOC124930220 [Impatiens glandulifera]
MNAKSVQTWILKPAKERVPRARGSKKAEPAAPEGAGPKEVEPKDKGKQIAAKEKTGRIKSVAKKTRKPTNKKTTSKNTIEKVVRDVTRANETEVTSVPKKTGQVGTTDQTKVNLVEETANTETEVPPVREGDNEERQLSGPLDRQEESQPHPNEDKTDNPIPPSKSTPHSTSKEKDSTGQEKSKTAVSVHTQPSQEIEYTSENIKDINDNVVAISMNELHNVTDARTTTLKSELIESVKATIESSTAPLLEIMQVMAAQIEELTSQKRLILKTRSKPILKQPFDSKPKTKKKNG